MTTANRSGPVARGTVCLTIDNLGDASEPQPRNGSAGEHFTIEVIARVLELLDRHRLPATFFVEAVNARMYPHVLRNLAARGHDVGCHAWRHEQWNALEPRRERALLARATGALRDLGLDAVGFRPPGGQLTAQTPALLTELGYRYHSPAGHRPGIAGGLAVVPFEWRLVDAFYYTGAFSGLRRRHGTSPDVQPPSRLRRDFEAVLGRAATEGAQATFVFHPMLLDGAKPLAAFEAVLHRIRSLIDDGAIECLAMRRLADRMLAAPASYPAPMTDTSSWLRAGSRRPG